MNRIKRRVYTAILSVMVAWTCTVPQAALGQLLPPLPLPVGSLIVNMASPASGSTVSNTVTVSASVSIVGSLTVQGVQFRLDGANLGGQDNSAPYSVSWNTTTASNGWHTLSAVARDLLGLEFTSDSVTVNVSNGPPPDTTRPSVGITSPANGSTVSNTITVTANASDNVGVVGVQFRVDGGNVGAEDTAAPYSASFNTTAVSNGSHTLTAVARDAAGNRTTSGPVTVNVSNGPPPDTTPPSVGITSPANGSTLSNTITVTADASDNVGVAGVQFRVDGANVGAEDTAAPYSASFNTTAVSNGSHTLTAVARDAAGNRTTSASVTVIVSNGSATVTRVEEDNPAVTASPAGAWVRRGAEIAAFSGGSASSSDLAGATVRFAFTGTAVSW